MMGSRVVWSSVAPKLPLLQNQRKALASLGKANQLGQAWIRMSILQILCDPNSRNGKSGFVPDILKFGSWVLDGVWTWYTIVIKLWKKTWTETINSPNFQVHPYNRGNQREIPQSDQSPEMQLAVGFPSTSTAHQVQYQWAMDVLKQGCEEHSSCPWCQQICPGRVKSGNSGWYSSRYLAEQLA